MGKVRLMKEMIHFYHQGNECIRVLLSNSCFAVCKSYDMPQLKKQKGNGGKGWGGERQKTHLSEVSTKEQTFFCIFKLPLESEEVAAFQNRQCSTLQL